jgi:hypothetical protein
VKLKSLVVITLLVLGCSFASAQSFGLLSYTGGLEYCNFEQMVISGGFYVSGFDNTSACGLVVPINANIGGAMVTVPAAAGAPVKGKNASFSDTLLDVLDYIPYSGGYEFFTNENVWSLSNLKAPTKLKAGKYSWALYVTFNGGLYLDNFGFLTTTLPSKNVRHNTSLGTSLKHGNTKKAFANVRN